MNLASCASSAHVLARGGLRTESAIRFDDAPCPRFRYPEDFDREKFGAWLRLSVIGGQPIEDVLVKIGAAERTGDELVFRNVGVLFFAKDVTRFFAQARITCLLAQGRDESRVIRRKDFAGGIVADIEDAMRFIASNAWTAYPMEPLREAITNAVMHRDWSPVDANVVVVLYTDRIEIISPGTLPNSMTLAHLGRTSIRRNPLIADLLHRITFVQKAGVGIARMRYGARQQDCPEPEFQVNDSVTVTFRPTPECRPDI